MSNKPNETEPSELEAKLTDACNCIRNTKIAIADAHKLASQQGKEFAVIVLLDLIDDIGQIQKCIVAAAVAEDMESET